uniref:Uncharacterized protein n=1 Tax=Rhizophora mucronata TaxID=61149 RepID=A0A2P2M5P3_RHIMU
MEVNFLLVFTCIWQSFHTLARTYLFFLFTLALHLMESILREEAINGLVRVHITLLKHGVDLSLRIINNLLHALHHLPRPRRYRRYSTVAPTAAAASSSSPTHSARPPFFAFRSEKERRRLQNTLLL